MTAVLSLQGHERTAFLQVMAPAFRDDPLIVATIGRRPAALDAFLSFMFDMTALMGGRRLGLVEDTRYIGCLLLEPPAKAGMANGIRMTLAAMRFMPVALRIPPSSTVLFNRYVAQTRSAAPKEPHAYLTMVGVAPDGQGKGNGRRLIEAAVEEARTMGAHGVALDTENPANVLVYEKLGFAQTAQLELGVMTSFCMYRPLP